MPQRDSETRGNARRSCRQDVRFCRGSVVPISGRPSHDEVVLIPSPDQAAALHDLGMLRTEELPMLAAHWLVDSNSESVARLAALDVSDAWLIDKLWLEVLADLGVSDTGNEARWARAVAWQVADWQAGGRSLPDVLGAILDAYANLGYPDEAIEAGHLNGLHDELVSDWGRAADQVWREVESVVTAWAARTPHP